MSLENFLASIGLSVLRSEVEHEQYRSKADGELGGDSGP